MTEEKSSKESDPIQEFKLEQDTELRFEVEGKEKVTVEVCYAGSTLTLMIILSCMIFNQYLVYLVEIWISRNIRNGISQRKSVCIQWRLENCRVHLARLSD